MSIPPPKRSDSRPSLWHRLKRLVITEAPEDIAICEFDCSRNQCTHGEWATCQRRIELQALCHPKQVEPAQHAKGDTPSPSRSDLVQN